MRDHRRETIANWKKYGILSDDYDKLYDYHMSINQCQNCNVDFDDTIKNQRCLDHDHQTGLYRKTLCRSCNATYLKAPQKLKANNYSGHMWICNQKSKNRCGSYSFTWRFQRKIDDKYKRKCFKNLSTAIAFSFIQLLKSPL